MSMQLHALGLAAVHQLFANETLLLYKFLLGSNLFAFDVVLLQTLLNGSLDGRAGGFQLPDARSGWGFVDDGIVGFMCLRTKLLARRCWLVLALLQYWRLLRRIRRYVDVWQFAVR